MELKGKVVQILETQNGTSKTGNSWKKGSFVIETEGQYPKQVCFTTWGAQVEAAEALSVGQLVNVHVDLESREFNGRWYTDAKAWKIDRESSDSYNQAPPMDDPFIDNEPPINTGQSLTDNSGDTEDLPF